MSGPGRTAAPPQQAPGKAGRRQSAQRSGERPGERSGQPRRSPARVRKPAEPRDIVGSPGRPLDGGLRREMEERLGHDFSRVRIHADADAAALTELLGADAVAVGTDIFFAAGAFRPESSAGRRLLAHELLHTVQVPYAPGPLRLGREAGALSRAAEPLEVEAERAAARDGRSPLIDARGSQPASWLRYTRVTADQQRAEQLDPATLVDRLVAGLLRSLRGDPADASGRVRLQLVRIAPELRSAVLERLEVRLPSSEYARVLDLMAVADTEAGAPPEPGTVPEPVEEPADRTEDERRGAQDDERADRDEGDQRDTDHGDEQDQRAAD